MLHFFILHMFIIKVWSQSVIYYLFNRPVLRASQNSHLQCSWLHCRLHFFFHRARLGKRRVASEYILRVWWMRKQFELWFVHFSLTTTLFFDTDFGQIWANAGIFGLSQSCLQPINKFKSTRSNNLSHSFVIPKCSCKILLTRYFDKSKSLLSLSLSFYGLRKRFCGFFAHFWDTLFNEMSTEWFITGARSTHFKFCNSAFNHYTQWREISQYHI